MSHPLVITIILNTNRRIDTLECLASLRKQNYTNHRAIVLDNASTDGSADAIQQQFPEVSVISLKENHGYAGNNNVGIDLAIQHGADWVFVLNEDTILDPDCLSELVRQGESDAKVGIVGPLVYHYDEPDVIQSAGGELNWQLKAWHRGQNETDNGQYGKPSKVDWVSGCAILVRRQAIEQIGPLDARFFYYWEETEWCLRAKRSGWQIIVAPSGKLWHKGVQRNYQPKPSVTYYNTRNRLMMLQKHRVSIGVWLATWQELGRTLASWTMKPKWRSQRDHRDAMWRGIVDFFAHRYGRGRPV